MCCRELIEFTGSCSRVAISFDSVSTETSHANDHRYKVGVPQT